MDKPFLFIFILHFILNPFFFLSQKQLKGTRDTACLQRFEITFFPEIYAQSSKPQETRDHKFIFFFYTSCKDASWSTRED